MTKKGMVDKWNKDIKCDINYKMVISLFLGTKNKAVCWSSERARITAIKKEFKFDHVIKWQNIIVSKVPMCMRTVYTVLVIQLLYVHDLFNSNKTVIDNNSCVWIKLMIFFLYFFYIALIFMTSWYFFPLKMLICHLFSSICVLVDGIFQTFK